MQVALIVSVPLLGKTLEEALAEARKLKFTDVVKVMRNPNSVDDYSMKVVGVESGEWVPAL